LYNSEAEHYKGSSYACSTSIPDRGNVIVLGVIKDGCHGSSWFIVPQQALKEGTWGMENL